MDNFTTYRFRTSAAAKSFIARLSAQGKRAFTAGLRNTRTVIVMH